MKNKVLGLLIIFIVNFFTATFAYEVYKTHSGQVIIIEEKHNNPIVTIDTWIKTGSINETDKNTGVSHFLEHLFFKGTQKYPCGTMDKILDSKGAISNAATSKDFTHYYITIPSKDFQTALELHSDMLLNPAIPDDELENERKVVLEEISKNNDSPERTLYNNLILLLYKKHPYHREVIGTQDVIKQISKDEIMKYYNKYYVPANMVTVVVGDVKSKEVVKQIKQQFKTNRKNKTANNNYAQDRLLKQKAEKIINSNVQTGYLALAFRGVNYKNQKESAALDLLSVILGGGKSSRLYQSLKEQQQLVYTVNADHSSYRDDSLFMISANYEPKNLEIIKQEIFSQIDNLKQNTITQEELNKAKQMLEKNTSYSRETSSDIANEIGYSSVVLKAVYLYKKYLSIINSITLEDLNKVANKYLKENTSAVCALVPENTKFLTQMPQIITQDKQIVPEKIDNIDKYTLNNGATMLVDKNGDKNIVAIKIYSLGGNYVEKTPGVAALTASLMTKSTLKYSPSQLAKIMDEFGILITPSSSSDTFSISLKTTKNDLEQALLLLDEIINNASLKNTDLIKIKKDKLATIKQTRDNPSAVAIEEFKTKIWEGNPYGQTGKVLEKTIPQIKISQIQEFYNQIFDAKNTVISVNGDVDDQQLIKYFSSLFLKKSSNKIKISDYKFQNKKITTTQTVNVNKTSNATWLVMGWQVAGNYNLKDYATLQIIDSIMGTGMSSRLFTQLREKQGLAYQVGSFYLPNINHGLFGVYIGTNPKNYTVAKQGILDEIAKLKTTEVNSDELQNAKDKILGQYLLSKETNMDKASLYGWFEISQRGVEFDKRYQKIIQGVTAQDVKDVANRYFNNNYVMSVVGEQNKLK